MYVDCFGGNGTCFYFSMAHSGGGKYNTIITSNNRGDYLAIMGTHCSVVFLTTSLMAMLSERNRYIYWVEMVNKRIQLS